MVKGLFEGETREEVLAQTPELDLLKELCPIERLSNQLDTFISRRNTLGMIWNKTAY